MGTARTKAPRGYHLEGGRWIKNAEVVNSVEVESFTSPTVEVIFARKRNTTWHIVTCRTSQTRPDKSGVSTNSETRVKSADSGIKAAQLVLDVARQRQAMAVIPPIADSLFAATCPTHGVIRRNSTIEYAIESAYWHALNEHDEMAS